MIIDSFDSAPIAIINPAKSTSRIKCDACIVTFSIQIEKYVRETFQSTLKPVGMPSMVNSDIQVFVFRHNHKTFGFYRTIMGAPATVSLLEEVSGIIDTKKFLVFGSCGILNAEVARGKIVVPTSAYRDEGTSYHYLPAQDYIEIKNASKVAQILEKLKLSYVTGKCWSTDGFYRETKRNFEKRKSEGCIVVDMECSALQAVCDFRGFEFFTFLLTGDVLDAPAWEDGNLNQANHNLSNFDIALKVAEEI